MRILLPFGRVLLAGLSLSPALAVAQEVGTAGAVNPASTGTPPSRPTRVLELGSRVIHRERIATSTGGNVQLVFLDKTTMSIGPNSEVVIDEFVYDPNAGTGRMAASMAKGVLRFVGGNTSHSGGAEIKTPSATLGIRGGVATVEVRPCGPGIVSDCGTKVTSHFGTLSITSAAGTEIIRRPGFVVSIPSPTAAPSAPRRATQAEVNQTNSQVSSKPGQNGGKARVTEAVIARADTVGPVLAQVGTAIISQQSQTVARQQSGSQVLGLSVAPQDATSPTQIQTIVADVRQQVTAQNTQVSAAASGNADDGAPIRPVVPASPQAYTLAYANGNVPFLPAAFAGLASRASQVLGYTDGGTTDGTPNTSSRVLQASLTVDGSGSAQTSSIFVLTGRSYVTTNGTNVFDGGYTASSGAANRLPARASGGVVASGSAVAIDSTFTPTSLTGRPGSVDGNGVVTPGTGTVATYPGRNLTNYDYTVTAARGTVPAGLGANRPAIDSVPNSYFGGRVAGLVTTTDNTARTVGTPSLVSGLLDLSFQPATSQFGVTLGINASSTDGNADGNALTTAFLDYGKPVNNFFSRPATVDGRGTFVDYSNFGAREAIGPDGAFTSTVNDTAVTDHRGVFVTSDTVNAKALFPNVAFCNCEFTRWGFWTSETTRTAANGGSLTDLVQLGTWVFGPPAEANQIPTTGVATYDGHAVASINNAGSQYVAAGNFQNVVNFGNRTGTATVSNLDGRTYTGAVTLSTDANGLFGSLATSTGPSTSLSLNGQFSRGTVGPAGEMLGNVTISGTNYTGSGIFAAATRSIGPAQ